MGGPPPFCGGSTCRMSQSIRARRPSRKIKNNKKKYEASSWYSSIYNSLYYSLCTTCILNSQVVLNIVLRVILLGFPPGATILYIRYSRSSRRSIVWLNFFLFLFLLFSSPPPFFSKRNDYTPKSKEELNESHANAYGKEFEEATDKIMMETSEPANCW